VADRSDAAASYTLEAILACGLISAVVALAPLAGPTTPSVAMYDEQALFDVARDSLTLLANLPPSDLTPSLDRVMGNETEFSQHCGQLESCLNRLLSPGVGFRFSCPWGTVASGDALPGARVQWIFLDTDTGTPREAFLEVWHA